MSGPSVTLGAMSGPAGDSAHAADTEFAADLAAVRSGDAVAFGRLWRGVHPMLVRYLRVVGGDLADDAAWHAWLTAIRGLAGFRGTGVEFRTWMVTLARTHLRQARRRATPRRGRLRAVPVDHRRAGAPAADPPAALEPLDTGAALALLAALPAEQAEMVALHVLTGLDVAAVGTVVGRNIGTVQVAINRGLSTLARTSCGGWLSAAQAPSTPNELSGEEGACALFTVFVDPHTPARRPWGVSWVIAAALTVVLAGGGVAAIAGPPGPPVERVGRTLAGLAGAPRPGSAGVPVRDVAAVPRAGTASGSEPATGDPASGTATATGGPLCRAFVAGTLPAGSSRLRRLARVAGSPALVAAYCARVLAATASATSTATPAPTTAPAAAPNQDQATSEGELAPARVPTARAGRPAPALRPARSPAAAPTLPCCARRSGSTGRARPAGPPGSSASAPG
jgi:RNA polymerase sigma-70 factor (ECF subfamily)